MLRFNPIDDPATGRSRRSGVGTTYTMPGRRRARTARTCSTATRATAARPSPRSTPWACATRRACRSIRRRTSRTPRWVGPDAGAPCRDLGPVDLRDADAGDHGGNYGWPYCMGDKQAYRDRVRRRHAAHRQRRRATSPAARRPARTNGWYDCNNLVNDSPNNTGLRGAPAHDRHGHGRGHGALQSTSGTAAATRATATAARSSRVRAARARRPTTARSRHSCARTLTANGATVMDGPVYRYDGRARDNSARWPKYWDGRWFLQRLRQRERQARAAARSGDRPGRQPADLRRQPARLASPGTRNYMDSKFGPDGALYVQTYDGFFRAGPDVGI